MTILLISNLKCEQCNSKIEIMFRKDKIKFSFNDNLFSEKEILSKDNFGNIICPLCKHKNYNQITIKKFL